MSITTETYTHTNTNMACFLIYLICYSPDVQALLLRDVIVFLQEKDQKYIFASLVCLELSLCLWLPEECLIIHIYFTFFIWMLIQTI